MKQVNQFGKKSLGGDNNDRIRAIDIRNNGQLVLAGFTDNIPVENHSSDWPAKSTWIRIFEDTEAANLSFEGGKIKYKPVDNFTGIDSFTYIISDGYGGTAEGIVEVTVNAINDAPVAVNDSVVTMQGETLVINVLGNDFDPDNDQLTVSLISQTSHGVVTMSSVGFVYSPDNQFTGHDSFQYQISDGQLTDVASVDVKVIKSHWTEPKFGIDFIAIKPGTFTMGAPDIEGGPNGYMNEDPTHEVTISKSFYMGKYEVTQGQWESVMNNNNPWPSNPPTFYGTSADHPAYNINWEDITKLGGFLDLLNQASGCDTSNLPTDQNRYRPDLVPAGCYRLPTEAEWEYVARAGCKPFTALVIILTIYLIMLGGPVILAIQATPSVRS